MEGGGSRETTNTQDVGFQLSEFTWFPTPRVQFPMTVVWEPRCVTSSLPFPRHLDARVGSTQHAVSEAADLWLSDNPGKLS